MYSHICRPSAPGPTPMGWAPLDLTYDDSNCFLLIFLAPNPTTELQASRHIHILLAQTNIVFLNSLVSEKRESK
jgi:hypothetical protein